MKWMQYIDRPPSELLAEPPFRDRDAVEWWNEGADPPALHFTFDGLPISFACTAGDGRITTIWIEAEEFEGQRLADVPYSTTREQVLDRWGEPSKSGPRRISEFLGKRGRWDRFDLPGCTLHVQFEYAADRIAVITLMRPDVAP